MGSVSGILTYKLDTESEICVESVSGIAEFKIFDAERKKFGGEGVAYRLTAGRSVIFGQNVMRFEDCTWGVSETLERR